MARGVKGSGKDQITTDEKIASIDKEIESHKKAITELTKNRKTLLKNKKNEDKEEVIKIAAESGLSAAELRDLIDRYRETV